MSYKVRRKSVCLSSVSQTNQGNIYDLQTAIYLPAILEWDKSSHAFAQLNVLQAMHHFWAL